MSIFDRIVRHWEERDPTITNAKWTWEKLHAWDRAHANSFELWEREAEKDTLEKAFELYSSDPKAAFQIWLDLGQCGSVWAMLDVARCYEYGDVVTCDATETELWYRRAFDGGSQVAMLKCARFALWREDFEACEEILRIGVQQDWPPAIFYLAWCRHEQSESRDTYQNIRPLLENAARRGHPGADFMLTKFMVNGKFGWLAIPWGILRAVPAAIRWTRINAELAIGTISEKSAT